MSGSNSGTATEPPSWSAATNDQLTTGEVLLIGFKPPGSGNPNSIAYSLTAAQVAALIQTGTIVGSELTAGAVATTIPNLPSIAAGGGNVLLQGIIVAQDQASGDCIAWNVALLAKRVPNGVTCLTVGDTTPAVIAAEGVFGTLTNPLIAAPSLGANSSGAVIAMTGLAGLTISWDFNLSFTESSI